MATLRFEHKNQEWNLRDHVPAGWTGALLFRNFLRADAPARLAWSRFKIRLAEKTDTLAACGAVKDPATDLLLALAERWAEDSGWTVPERGPS
jgi:hypothetical protein